jgi:hypothetical protein
MIVETNVVQGQQPAISEQTPSGQNPVAPIQQSERVLGEMPGIPPARVIGQPAEVQQPGIASQEDSAPEVDYKARYEAAEQDRLQRERESSQYRQAFGQLQAMAAQQQQNQALHNHINMILATSENMSAQEGSNYLRNQMLTLTQQQQNAMQQMLQQREQAFDQERKALAAPSYVDHLVTTLGFSEQDKELARQELLALRDPDLMYQQAPALKARYDAMNKRLSGLSTGQQQLARTAEVNQIRQNGLANMGGQMGSGSYQLEVSDDPDIAALQVLQHLEERQRMAQR